MKTIRKLCWPCFFVQLVCTLALILAGLISLAIWSSWWIAIACAVLGYLVSRPTACFIYVAQSEE